MPAISKIRFTNVVYEDGMKRYNDELFKFDGYNSAILLENGGGKTVYIQTALQAIIPHTNLADRKIKDTLQLDSYPAHIAIEWLISEQPRRYLVTAVSLFLTKNGLDSYRYVYDYEPGNKHNIEAMPFVKSGQNRPSDRGEISEYYQYMTQQSFNAKTFQTIKAYQTYIEDQYHIVANEWESIVKINSTEGGVEAFFDECKQTNQLLDRLLIPTVENAISGHDQHTFADTFEKHRESFKLYKELKEQIEENKSIEEELECYVDTFERLHASEQTYEAAKQKAKGLLQLIQIQEQEQASALTHIQGKHQQWENDSSAHEMDQVSLIIQEETSRLNELDILYKDAEQALEEAKEALQASRYRYYSLKLAALKQTFEKESSQIAYYEDELEKVDAEVDVTELKDYMDENSEALMGCFSHEIEQSLKREQAFDIELASLSEQVEELGNVLREKKKQLKQVESNLSSIKGKLESLEEEKKRIQTQVLANPEQETIEEQLPPWKARHSFLDEEMVSLTNDNKKLSKIIQANREDMTGMKDNKEEMTRSLVKAEAALEQLDKAHNQLKETLAARRPQWTHLESVYLKQESIEQYLTETQQKLGREKDEFMQHERLAHRLLDDHGEQDLFFADPVLEKQIHSWSNQFSLLETGVQYIQGLNYTLEEMNKFYPLWPQALITTVQDKQALIQKVTHINNRIQIPIDVLSTEDVRRMIQDETMPRRSIVPEHWLSNQNKDQFGNWKKHLNTQAEEATNARVEKEQVIQKWKHTQYQFYNFMKEYPYHLFKEQRDEVLQLQEQLQTLNIKLRELEQKNTEYQEKIETNLARIEDYKSEYHGLETKLSQSLRYMECVKEMSNLSNDMDYYHKKNEQFERMIGRQEHEMDRLREDRQHQDQEKNREKWYRAKILDDRMYQEVKDYSPRYTNDTKDILLLQRNDLKMQLHHISKSRGEIEAKLNNARDNKENADKSLEELRREEGELDEALVFPENGDLQMDDLLTQMKTWQTNVDRCTEDHGITKTNRDKQEQNVENKLNDFAKAFPDQQPVEFNETTASVQERLHEEAKQLNDQKKYLDQEETRIQAELESIKAAFNQIDRFEEAHHFKGPSVTATELTQDDINTFSYNRLPFTKTTTERLTDHRKKLNQEWDKVNGAKEHFKLFCKNKVTNVKMREMVIQGVDRKQSYQDVMEFQSHMKKRVQHAIRYAEESIMTHDQQLEQFITHVHNHLRTITQELTMIPKKTKVKVEDKWKDIYKFSIPEWTEEDGKERLRHHIEWIVEQLDKDSYRHAEGHEDYGKVRNDIETWLHSKQLIRIVMNNEMIKVTCRKVTNDNQVTTRSYSWEQSNVWSGGEKWSKNMTLFLGILNYVAEKQKHIQTNMKRHRAVILDNPFGKASSDHVLNPVFFIAEQLGFQIIALTAHAEGKFLRDYFPVIYSCRLRLAQDPTKQIMTKEKQLHHAYFQDHDPQSLERLGEVEQIELF